ncbi:hypothetical protein D3C87_1932250 [compost metagenome]
MTHLADSQVEPVIKFANNNPDLRICYKSSRAISTIQRLPDGTYQVVKLYEGEVSEFVNYTKARTEAMSAAMTQAPRTKKDAA